MRVHLEYNQMKIVSLINSIGGDGMETGDRKKKAERTLILDNMTLTFAGHICQYRSATRIFQFCLRILLS